MNRSINALLIAGAAVPLLTFAGCGSDDSNAGNTAACNTWIAADGAVTSYLFTGEGDTDSLNAALDAAIAAADPDIKQTMTDLKTEAQPQFNDPESEASDKTLQLYGAAIAWAGKSCDVDKIDVTAKDYKYEGIPDKMSTGYHVVNFSNEGQEQHEMFAFRINDGVTESLDEIFNLPEEEVFGKLTPVNASFAFPGKSDTGSWNLTTPGKYAVVCFIPVGSIGETEGDGPPHLAQGMRHEFTVS